MRFAGDSDVTAEFRRERQIVIPQQQHLAAIQYGQSPALGMIVSHIEYLNSVYNLSNRAVLDVGAGDGTFSRLLEQVGANVTGIEIDQDLVDTARASLPEHISLLVGRAEALPVDDSSQDIACFFFSFHHVPMNVQERALAEIRRVLKPGGRLHVVEPFPYGSMFDVVRMVEDETHVRTHSHRLMADLGARPEFNLLARKEYTLTREYPDFEIFLNKIVRSNPDRMAKFPTVEMRCGRFFIEFGKKAMAKRSCTNRARGIISSCRLRSEAGPNRTAVRFARPNVQALPFLDR